MNKQKLKRVFSVVPILGFVALLALLASCDVWGPRNNSSDPSAANYQGYATVTSSAEIRPVTPLNGDSLSGSKLTVNKLAGAMAYELRIASSVAELDTNPLFDKADYTSNEMDLAAAPIVNTKTYYWKLRAKEASGSWGEWVGPYSFIAKWSTAAKIPVFSLAAGCYSTDQALTLSSSTPYASFYYTTDGTTPTISSTKYTSAGISIAGDGTSMTVKAIAVAVGFTASSASSADYSIDKSIWTDRSSAGMRNWYSIASSSDGSHLAAVVNGGDIWTSADYGATWIDRSAAGPGNWRAIASSSDGSHLAAAAYGGDIWTSTDSGLTWTNRSSGVSGLHGCSLTSIASSSDGSRLAAAIYGGYVWTSADSGTTWTKQTTLYDDWSSICSSADGSHLAVGGYYTYISKSANLGVSWASTLSYSIWKMIAMSSDGLSLAVAPSYGDIRRSTDFGATWYDCSMPGYMSWSSICSSADGSRLAAAASSGSVWASADSGVTWVERKKGGSRSWQALASSADGSHIAAVVNGGDIWTGVLPP